MVKGSPHAADASRGNITAAMRDACAEVSPGGTLLMFFSGHGLHYQGQDYLVPGDADLRHTWDTSDLIRVNDISKTVGESKASRVILFVDACREGIMESKAVFNGWGSEQHLYTLNRQYSIVFSCRPGELSRYVSGPEGFSLFSRAVASALSIQNPARTLGQVIADAQTAVDELRKQYNKQPQQITLRTEAKIDDHPEDVVICEGRQTRVTPIGEASWEEVVRTSRLWDQFDADGSMTDEVGAYRDIASEIAARAEQSYRNAADEIGLDPWRDYSYPVRAVRRLEEITNRGVLLDLNLPETALLLVAPFAREHAYAGAMRALALAQPTEIDVDAATLPQARADIRRQLEVTFRSHPQLIRRATRLLETGKAKQGPSSGLRDSRFVMLWLLHRHVARFAAMWHHAPHGTLPQDTGRPGAESAGLARAAKAVEALSQERVLKLAKCVRSETDRLTRRDMPYPLEGKVSASSDGTPIRERLLGTVLCLAGWIALDMRAASEVVVDHLGIADPLDPAQLMQVVANAVWIERGRQLELTATCQHPAIDFVLREMVSEANRILAEVSDIIFNDEKRPDLAEALPAQFSPDGIVPVKEQDHPVYSGAQLSFTLAQTEVRELLMGVQLYGNPDLAIREVYQNALDACRYRQARLDFLARSGNPNNWRGKIVFRQGAVGGRAFIECEDNGIGMSTHEIEQCFARAGKRFADLPEFVEEQELWMQCRPPIRLYPNSQFGIGVLSYFMIADEIELTTRRLDRQGHLEDGLRVRIPGTGCLFRIQQSDALVDGGTKLRLYLRQDWNKSVSEILKELLIISEFETEVDGDGEKILWQPGVPLQTHSLLQTDDPDFWWVSSLDGGRVLADGIKTNFRQDDERFAARVNYIRYSPFGCLINLRNQHRPRLSVDRAQIIDFDDAWVIASYERHAPRLTAAPWLRFAWLWHLPAPVREPVVRTLAEANSFIPIGYLGELFPFAFSQDQYREIIDEYNLMSRGFPLRILGIEDEDRLIITRLIRSLTAQDSRSQLNILNEFCRRFIQVPDQETSAAQERGELELARLSGEKLYDTEPRLYRAGIYTALGFPAAQWIRPFLPEVDIDELSRRLEKGLPLEPTPPTPPMGFWQKIGSQLSNLIDKIGDYIPNWLFGSIMIGMIAILGYAVISLLVWGLPVLWEYVF
jgi:hypothetical protein